MDMDVSLEELSNKSLVLKKFKCFLSLRDYFLQCNIQIEKWKLTVWGEWQWFFCGYSERWPYKSVRSQPPNLWYRSCWIVESKLCPHLRGVFPRLWELWSPYWPMERDSARIFCISFQKWCIFFTSSQSLEPQYARLLLSSCPENTGHPSSNAILSGNRNAWLESPIITIFFIAMLVFSLHKSCFAAPLLQLNPHIELSELPWIPITSPPSILKNVEYLLLLMQCRIVQAT